GDATRGRDQNRLGKIVDGGRGKEHPAGCALIEMSQRASSLPQPEGDLRLPLAALMRNRQWRIDRGSVGGGLCQHLCDDSHVRLAASSVSDAAVQRPETVARDAEHSPGWSVLPLIEGIMCGPRAACPGTAAAK